MVLDSLVNTLSSMYSPLDLPIAGLESGGNGDLLGAGIWLVSVVAVPVAAFYISNYAGRAKKQDYDNVKR